MNKLYNLVLALCLAVVPVVSSQNIGMASDLTEANLKKLIDKPVVLSSSIKELPKDAEGV